MLMDAELNDWLRIAKANIKSTATYKIYNNTLTWEDKEDTMNVKQITSEDNEDTINIVRTFKYITK